MAEKNLRTKTTKIWGKGGNLVSLILIFSLIFQPVAFAGRSSAGGGKLAKPDWGKVATNVGISIGAAVIMPGIQAAGPAATGAQTGTQLTQTAAQTTNLFTGMGNLVGEIGNGIINLPQTTLNFVTNTAGGGIPIKDAAGNVIGAVRPLAAMKDAISIGNMVTGYSTFVATSQVNRAVGMAGAYYGWKPSNTFMLSSVATGATAGFLNPSAALGKALPIDAEVFSTATMSKGAIAGAMQGLGSSLATIAVDSGRLNSGKGLSAGGQVVGLVGGLYGSYLGQTMLDPKTNSVSMAKIDKTGNSNIFTYKGQEINLREQAGIANMEQAFRDSGTENARLLGPNETLSIADAKKILQDSQSFSNGGTDKVTFATDGKFPTPYTLTAKQVEFLDTVQVDPYGNTWANVTPFGGPQPNATDRILMGPVVSTFNQWPLLASESVAIFATQNMSDSARPFVRSAVRSVGNPAFETVATAYNLKPSLAGNIDERLNYYPTEKFQRVVLAEQAIKDKVWSEIQHQPIGNVGDIKEAKQIIPETLKLNPTEQQEIFGIFLKARTTANNMTPDNAKRLIYEATIKQLDNRVAANVNTQDYSKGVYNNFALLEEIGGSRNAIVNRSLKYAIRNDLPLGLITGGVESGFNSLSGNGDNNTFTSLAAVKATSAIRGVLWHTASKDAYENTIQSIRDDNYSPEVALGRTIKDQGSIVLARSGGELPLADIKRYSISEVVGFVDAEKQLPVGFEEVKGNLNNLNKALTAANLPGIEIPQTQSDMVSMPLDVDKLQSIVTTQIDNEAYRLTEEKLASDPEALAAFQKYSVAGDKKVSSTPAFERASQAYADIRTGINKKVEGQATGFLAQLQNVTAKYEFVPDKNGQYTTMSNTTKSVDTVRVFKLGNEMILPGDKRYASVKQVSGETLYKGQIGPIGTFMLGNERVEGYQVTSPVSLGRSVKASLDQGLYEFGYKSLSMGLPYSRDGRLDTYAWNSYARNLNASSRQGFFNGLAAQMTDTGIDVSTRNVMTSLANTPVGEAFDLAKTIPVSGYKGALVTPVVMEKTSFGGADARFYRQWPNPVGLGVVSNDKFRQAIRAKQYRQLGKEDELPVNGVQLNEFLFNK